LYLCLISVLSNTIQGEEFMKRAHSKGGAAEGKTAKGDAAKPEGGEKKSTTRSASPAAGDEMHFPISARSVRTLAEHRCTKKEIALILGCPLETIEKEFGAEYEAGVAEFKRRLREAQVESMSGSVPMQIWLGKNYLRQTDSGELPETDEEETTFVEIYDASDPAAAAAAAADEHMPDRLP
jgi:hypothetical protein